MNDKAPIPNIINAAGDAAVRVYREFLADPKWSSSTRSCYARNAKRFLRWAETHGLTLETIDPPALAVYAAEIAATQSSHAATVYLTSVYGVLGRLVSAGVLATDPCPKHRQNGRTLPLAELKRIVLEIGKDDGWQEGDESFQAGLVLIAPLSITTMDPMAVSQFTGVPEPLVREFAGRLIENGVWRPDGKLAVQWNDPENGNLAFMMDVWVAMGELERGTAPETRYSRARPRTDSSRPRHSSINDGSHG